MIASLLFLAAAVTVAPTLEEQGFFTAYSRNWMLGYLFIGAIFYTIDRTWLVKVKAWFKDPSAKSLGFIYGQKVSQKVVWAGVISTIETFAFLFLTPWNSHLSVELFLWLIDIPMMLIGFGVGALLFPLWEKREKGYRALDEAVETIEKGMERAGAKSAPVTPTPEPAPAAPEPAPVAPAAEAVPAAPVEPKLSPEERIKAYAKR